MDAYIRRYIEVKRKAFTLYELLIVIVVIGILSSAMMLSSTEAITTARATSIINNLLTIRKATLEWYTDNREYFNKLNLSTPAEGRTSIQKINQGDQKLGIGRYLDDATRTVMITGNETITYKNKQYNEGLPEGKYGIFNVEWYRTTWYAGYRFKKGEEAVKAKVKARSKMFGLIFSGMYPNPGLIDTSLISDDRDVEGDDTVWLFVLGNFRKTEKDW